MVKCVGSSRHVEPNFSRAFFPTNFLGKIYSLKLFLVVFGA